MIGVRVTSERKSERNGRGVFAGEVLTDSGATQLRYCTGTDFTVEV